MTEDFNVETLHYLLGELDAPARADFEKLVARDLAARVTLKACSAVVAQFACEIAPPEPMPPLTQRAALAAILATVATEPRSQPLSFPWKRLAWPLAAAVLVVLNLLQFFQPNFANQLRTAVARVFVPSSHAPRGDTPAVSPEKKRQTTTEVAGKPQQLQPANSADESVTEEMHRLEKLHADYITLEHAREALSAEYDGIVRQLAQRALINKGVGRLAAMELVDPRSYARGERKGLVDIARGLLTAPGIVTIEPSPAPPAVPSPNQNPQPSPIVPTPIPDPMASIIPGMSNPVPFTPVNPPATAPETTTPQALATNTTDPYAWSVFDEASSKGYLNLYNLPATPADQSLQLWVKVANSDTYQRIGEVPPQFYGGAGSLYYNLPGATQPPSDILITQEPRNATPTQPTGPTVLHGP